ncbi:hypothetical protein [Roseomonas sp. BN140053]|uniref:hypothetical protein n=1 Tax=Roseomonas sp. BN140053 TaxID=3391898 RepID=UPI0039E8B1AE
MAADRLGEAAARLEAAVERLAIAAARPRPSMSEGEVAELSRRLDSTLARLRLALAREDGEAEGEGEDDPAELPPDEQEG